MRELVEAIDSHVELVDLEVINNLRAVTDPVRMFSFSHLQQPSSHPRTLPTSSLQTLQPNCRTKFLLFTFLLLK